MLDQATELRRLVLQAAREEPAGGGPAPRLLVLCGGKGGVGVTSLAVNLSAALALRGSRVVLVDANLYQTDVAAMCGVAERGSTADVLAGRRTLPEALERGSAGLRVLPGLCSAGAAADFSPPAQQRLLRQLRALQEQVDLVVLDAGHGASEVMRRFWSAADGVVLVTTPDSMAMMDSYAAIKRLCGAGSPLPLRLLVNQASDSRAAAEVHRRIDGSCQRFLGFGIDHLGHVPPDTALPKAGSVGRPVVLSVPGSPAAVAILGLAASVSQGPRCTEFRSGGHTTYQGQSNHPADSEFPTSDPSTARLEQTASPRPLWEKKLNHSSLVCR